MQLGRFGYHVSREQRQREVAENDAIVAQIGARAALLPFYEQAVALGWTDFEPEYLACLSPEACAALGVPLEHASDLLDAIGVNDVPAWMPTSTDSYRVRSARGEAILAAVQSAFGTFVALPGAWPKMRADALRRAATARRALRAAAGKVAP